MGFGACSPGRDATGVGFSKITIMLIAQMPVNPLSTRSSSLVVPKGVDCDDVTSVARKWRSQFIAAPANRHVDGA